GHLIGGAADATRAHFDRGHDVVERLLEHGDRALPGLALDDVERAIDNRLRSRLLAGVHHGVHEFRDHHVPEFRVRLDLALIGPVTTRHLVSSSVFPFLKTQNEPKITWAASLRISIAAACG